MKTQTLVYHKLRLQETLHRVKRLPIVARSTGVDKCKCHLSRFIVRGTMKNWRNKRPDDSTRIPRNFISVAENNSIVQIFLTFPDNKGSKRAE